MLPYRYYYFYYVLLLLTAPLSSATAKKPVNMTNIHSVCIQSPTECLSDVDQALLATTVRSRVWFDLMQYKLDSLFFLQKITELHTTVKPWVNDESLPTPFKITLYIYYAKSLSATNISEQLSLTEQRKIYIKKAESQLALMNSVYPNPMLLIQLANLKMYVGEDNKENYQSLQKLAIKYERRQDPVFKLELYGNLAHLAVRLGYKQQAINYWLETITWAKKYGNYQQIATVYYNLARNQVIANQLDSAKKHYLLALEYTALANDQVLKELIQYYLAKLLFKQGLHEQAKEIVRTINTSRYTPELITALNQLKSLLTQEPSNLP